MTKTTQAVAARILAGEKPAGRGQYQFIEDPGHGWLRVPVAEARKLGIGVSSCSYIGETNEDWLYLEEDCDALAFIIAALDAQREGLTRESISRWQRNHVQHTTTFNGADFSDAYAVRRLLPRDFGAGLSLAGYDDFRKLHAQVKW